MTYLFTNPEVKRWKTLFGISLFLNAVLAVAFFVDRYEQPSVAERADVPRTVEAAPAAPAPASAAGPAVGEKLAVWLTVTDNFYNAFTNDAAIAGYAAHYDFPRLAEILSVQVSRLLMWDLTLRREILKGDTLSFVFRMIPPDELKVREDMPDSLEVLAVSYFSQRLNKFIDLYAYRAASSAYQRFFYGDGRSLEKRLQSPPLRDHIQIIALFDEGVPRHEGIDFKTPTGTPVHATFDGRVSRTNWQSRFNGYSIEVTAKDSLHAARYLHLSEVLVSLGQEVKAGELIAKSGNTGKAPLPHLHYEVSTAGKAARLLDPFSFHGFHYEQLKGDELKKFQELVVDHRILLKKVSDR